MSFTFRASATSETATVNKPTGTVLGDLLIAYVATNGDDSITWPSGWSEDAYYNDTVFGGTARVRIGHLIAGGSEPASYTWADYGGAFINATIACYQLPGSPKYASVANFAENASGTTLAAGQVATPRDNCLIVYGGSAGALNTWSSPVGVTERADWSASFFADEVQAIAGLSTSRTFTFNETNAKIIITAAFFEDLIIKAMDVRRRLAG